MADPLPGLPSLMNLPEDLLRSVLNRLRIYDKLRASRVSKDFRRILVTDADKGSWHDIVLHIGPQSSSIRSLNAACWFPSCWFPSILLFPCLLNLFGRGRSKRFSEIHLSFPEDGGDDPFCSSALVAAAELLRSDGYSGLLRVASLSIRRESGCLRALRALTHVSLPFEVGSIDLVDAKKPLSCMRHLTQLASLKQIAGITEFSVPQVPALNYAALLSGPCPIQTLSVGRPWDWEIDDEAWDTAGMSLTQLRGLENVLALDYRPRIAGDISALSTLTRLAKLSRDHCTPECWRGLSDALTALTALSEVSLNIWDPGAEAGAHDTARTSPLSSLDPLWLPDSVTKARLWFRLPPSRRSLTLDFFGDTMGRLTNVFFVVVTGREPMNRHEGRERLSFCLGPSLSALTSLKELWVEAGGRLSDRTAFKFPAAFSSLTSLTEFGTEGSNGTNRFGSLPRHWRCEGLDLGDPDVKYSHPT